MTPPSTIEARQQKRVDSILISQPAPREGKTAYDTIINKFGIKVDYRAFTEVNEVDARGIRKQKVAINDYPAVIFTSITSVAHYFRLMKEMGFKISEDTRYFCLTEAIANNLSKYINVRRRRVFNGNRHISEMKTAFTRYKAEKFLFPCSNLGAKEIIDYLASINVNFQEVMMFETVSADLKDLEDVFYDILVFFTPQAIESLFENFPTFKQNATRIAVAGNTTAQAAIDRGLIVDIQLTSAVTSMPQALEQYVKISNQLPNSL
jgi:uroporphyrinogen-III synthase